MVIPDPPTAVTHLSMPSYCIKSVGPRHFLVGGGGGAAKTGVKNELQLYLLTYNTLSSMKNPTLPQLRAKLAASLDTGVRCNMNCDVVSLTGPQERPYFIAAVGQDQFCQLYLAIDYALVGEQDDELECPARLSLDFKPILKLITDEAADDPYQKCVRFDRSRGLSMRVATGGTDGYVRVWDVGSIIENPDPRIEHTPIVDFKVCADSKVEVDDVDFSFCGRFLSTVCAREATIWDANTGKKLGVIPTPKELVKDFKVRSVRYTRLGHQSTVFCVAFQQRQRSSKQRSYIGIVSFNPASHQFHEHELKMICREAVSCLSVHSSSHFLAVGTMEGSVLCLDTARLALVYSARNTHKSFVTAVEFLPDVEQRSRPNAPADMLPGPGAEAMVTFLSLSVDQVLKSHKVPWLSSQPFSKSVLKFAFVSLIVYLVAFLLLEY